MPEANSKRKTFEPGTHEHWAQATDALGRSQPLDGKIFWNPNGYEWTGIFKYEVWTARLPL